MPDQVPDDVKRERIERLVERVQRVAAKRNARRVGMVEAGAGRKPEPYRSEAPARPDAPEHDGQLQRRRCSRRDRPGCDRERDVDDSRRRAASRSPRPDEVLVIGLFGPTASGKSDIAAAVTELDSGRGRLGRRDAGLRRPADPHEPVASSGEARRHLAALARRVGGGVRAARARCGRRDPRGRADTPRRGRTGLYFRAALAELDLPPAPAPGARERWERFYDESGSAAVHARLGELDPAAAARVHPNDRRRVVRALELAEAGGSLVPQRDTLFGGAWRHPTLLVGLRRPEARARAEDRGTDKAHVRGRRRG